VARHAGATRIDAVLDDTGDALVLEVRDNGRGIAPNEMAGSRSMGLAGMRERAALVGGVLSIERLQPRGTLVSVHVPNQGTARAAI
jgi:signal transduction histidine kinase